MELLGSFSMELARDTGGFSALPVLRTSEMVRTRTGSATLWHRFCNAVFKRRKHAKAMVAVLNMPGGRPGPESPRIAGPEREVRTLVVLNLIGLGKNNGTIIIIK